MTNDHWTDPMNELCGRCGLTFGSHCPSRGNSCPQHEGRMDWRDDPKATFVPTETFDTVEYGRRARDLSSHCSDCGTSLTTFFYGYGDCSGHVREDFVQVEGFRVDATDGLGDWDNGPTYLLIPHDVEKRHVTFWLSKDRCCSRLHLDDGEPDWCPKCGDAVEPGPVALSAPTPEPERKP